jgi:hypothetical protein
MLIKLEALKLLSDSGFTFDCRGPVKRTIQHSIFFHGVILKNGIGIGRINQINLTAFYV